MIKNNSNDIPFPQKISPYYASKFRSNNCPLKKQVKFSSVEKISYKGYKNDPIGDKRAEIDSGILQKYKGRLLVLASDECAIHCRFCFRRNIRYKKRDDLSSNLAGILKKDKSIKEVILSGGDPLMLKNSELQTLFNAIPPRLRIRIHSRIPVAMPDRFTPDLWSLLEQLSCLIFVVHVNHPNELDKKSEKIFTRLAKNGVVLLNQSVLLKGVNDNAKTLAELSEKLFSQKVLPYYLHSLDKAQGTAHFEVPQQVAKSIYKELKNILPGYLVPKMVKEIKGSKVIIS